MGIVTKRVVVLSLVCLIALAHGRAEAAEGRAHILIVADTDAENIGELTRVDGQMMLSLFTSRIPERSRTVKVLSSREATPDQIRAYFRRLESKSADTLLLFYSGHGAWDVGRGHLLTLNAGTMERSELLNLMKGKDHRLIVLLTNACSNLVSSDEGPSPFARKGRVERQAAGELDPVMRALLFEEQGVVDITAAEIGTYAFGHPTMGGFFTIALREVLSQPAQRLDNGTGSVSWQTVFPLIRRRTEAIFQTVASYEPQLALLQARQRPLANSLGGRPDGDDSARSRSEDVARQRERRQPRESVRRRSWEETPQPGDVQAQLEQLQRELARLLEQQQCPPAPPAPREDATPVNPQETYAVVTISNPTLWTIQYGVRWGANGQEQAFVLGPGGSLCHWCKPAVQGQVPTPYIRYRTAAGAAQITEQRLGYSPSNRKEGPGKVHSFALSPDGMRIQLTAGE
jgi:hypothetical protein